jgi:hypothetical protein
VFLDLAWQRYGEVLEEILSLDYVNMMLSVAPNYLPLQVVGYMKDKSPVTRATVNGKEAKLC